MKAEARNLTDIAFEMYSTLKNAERDKEGCLLLSGESVDLIADMLFMLCGGVKCAENPN